MVDHVQGGKLGCGWGFLIALGVAALLWGTLWLLYYLTGGTN